MGGVPTRSVPMSVFGYAPRFHEGGGIFGPNEYPAVLMRGERVLNPWETRAYNSGLSASGGNSSPQVNIQIINNAGAQVETSQRQNEDGSLDVEIMIDQMVTRSMVKRSGGASNVLRKGYGMSMIPTSR